jgi:hypothetical protein
MAERCSDISRDSPQGVLEGQPLGLPMADPAWRPLRLASSETYCLCECTNTGKLRSLDDWLNKSRSLHYPFSRCPVPQMRSHEALGTEWLWRRWPLKLHDMDMRKVSFAASLRSPGTST